MKRLVACYKNGPLEVHQLSAGKDNYIYLLHDSLKNVTAVIDPTDSDIVASYCAHQNWRIDQIFITHHHPDHTDGNLVLKEKFNCPIYAFKDDAYRIPGVTKYLEPPTQIDWFGHSMDVLFTPGHTLGHICFYLKKENWLFCGDTLFSFGCGRLFEGTPEMMLESLKKIRSLPHETLFFCSHEYTLSNLEFAINLEPDFKALHQTYAELKELRASNKPTVPALLSKEKNLNPFLRWDDPQLKITLGMNTASDLEVFTHVRQLRNHW